MIDNKISQVYTAEMVQVATKKIAEIKSLFPCLLNLKTDERATYLNMGERTGTLLCKRHWNMPVATNRLFPALWK